MTEQTEGFEIVYAGPDTFIRKAFQGDATGKWCRTFTEARKAAIDMLREPRDKYNEAIARFKSMKQSDATVSFGPVGYIRG